MIAKTPDFVGALNALYPIKPKVVLMASEPDSSSAVLIGYSESVYAVCRFEARASEGEQARWLLDYQTLFELVKLGDESRHIVFDAEADNRLQIKQEGFINRLNLLSHRFDLAPYEQLCSASLPLLAFDRAAFVEAFGRVAFAAASNDARPTLTGVLMRTDKGLMTLAAADGYRMSIKTLAAPLTEELRSWLVPADLTRRILEAQTEDQLQIGSFFGLKRFVIRCGNAAYIINEIDGGFPNFQELLKSLNLADRLQVRVDLGEMKDALKAALVFARDDIGRVVLSLKDDALCLSASSGINGGVERAVRVVFDDGETQEKTGVTFSATLNGEYLVDYIAHPPKAVKSMTAFLMSGENINRTPFVFRLDGERDDDFYLVMPFSA